MGHISYIPMGRLGNAMYQICTMIAMSLDKDMPFSMPHQTSSQKWSPIYFKELVAPDFNPQLVIYKIEENRHEYYELPFEEHWKQGNVLLSGYFQSYKRFNHRRNEILYLLDLPYQFNEGEVACHVRRTDYLILKDKHPQVGKDWYEKAMAMDCFKGMKFRFYSDDIDWCIQEFGNRKDCSFAMGQDELTDLTQMAWAEHQICSSSTFSVFGHWLNRNKNKIGVFPDKWFVDNYHLVTNDILEPHCIKLPL